MSMPGAAARRLTRAAATVARTARAHDNLLSRVGSATHKAWCAAEFSSMHPHPKQRARALLHRTHKDSIARFYVVWAAGYCVDGRPIGIGTGQKSKRGKPLCRCNSGRGQVCCITPPRNRLSTLSVGGLCVKMYTRCTVLCCMYVRGCACVHAFMA
jgi:hypothetical protein